MHFCSFTVKVFGPSTSTRHQRLLSTIPVLCYTVVYTILIHLYWYYMVYSQSHTLKLYLYYLLFYTVLSNRYCAKLHTPEVTSRLNCYIIVHKVLLL